MQHQIFNRSLLVFTFFSPEVLAHNVQTNGNVGVTFHIEPDHSPRAGDRSTAWFALTRRGGELIPLSKCDCELKVYLESGNNSNDEPVLTPSLIPISAEQYQDIPGADIVFPQPGIYQLQLIGKPVMEGDFASFEVSYPVTVNPGVATLKTTEDLTSDDSLIENQPIASVTQEVDKTTTTVSDSIYPLLIGALIGGLGLAALFWLKFNKQ